LRRRKDSDEIDPLAEIPLVYLLGLPGELVEPRVQLPVWGSQEVASCGRTLGKLAIGKGMVKLF
jgi:hypothetical protein